MHLSQLPSADREYDVCVVGAGPVGITVALECEAAGLSVLLIEAGLVKSRKPINGSGGIEIVDTARHAPIDVVTRTGLGGTSAVWGGRCVPFDEIDFEPRSFVPHSGWPISHEELKPWYAKAASYLDCGLGGFISPLPDWDERPEVTFRSLERLSSQPRLGRRFADKLRKSPRLDLKLGRAVSGVNLNTEGDSVRSLIFTGGSAAEGNPRARAFVLACGGLHSTRILLDLQRNWPRRFGGDAGPLGRYYMGHLTGKIASIVLHNPADVKNFDYTRDESGYWFRRRFSLQRSALIEREILNTVFWLGNPPFHDLGHGSAAASSIFLALTLPIVGRRFLSGDTFAFHRGAEPELGQHWAKVLGNPMKALAGVTSAVKSRLTPGDLRPFFLRNDRGEYALHYHSEQIPNPNSRIRLIGNNADETKMSVDFRFCDDDSRSIVRAHEVLDDALRQSGKGYVKYWQSPEERLHQVLLQAQDGYHQIGTARMANSDRMGVVDRNCRVHGLNNLYVAGSAVFPTSGQANSTFGAVAIAARVADELRKNFVNRAMAI
jgi:choline dehydrogenase-like flavoprotein